MGPRTEMALGATPATRRLDSHFIPEQFTVQIYSFMYLYTIQTVGDASTPLANQRPDPGPAPGVRGEF